MKYIVILLLILSINAYADDTFVQIQEMVNDLGGQRMIKKNNGKLIKCANSGTKRISINNNTYRAVYNNCREYGSVRDGERFISLGGGDIEEERITIRKGEPQEYTIDSEWNVNCNNKTKICLAVSGNVDINFDGKRDKLLGTYGIPNATKALNKSYVELNKYFGKKYIAAADENKKFVNWVAGTKEHKKSSWSFCSNAEVDNSQHICEFVPYFIAAEEIITYYNMNRLDELAVQYLLSNKYYNETILDKTKSDSTYNVLNLARWCAYAPCTNQNSVVKASANGKPFISEFIESYKFINDIEYLSEIPKIDNPVLKDYKDDIVADADEPLMYKKALEYIENSYNDFNKYFSKSNISISTDKNNDITENKLNNIKVVAQQLVQQYKLPASNAYAIAYISLSGIYRNTISTGDNWRHVEFNDRYAIGLKNKHECFLPIRIGDKFISTEEIDRWISENNTK